MSWRRSKGSAAHLLSDRGRAWERKCPGRPSHMRLTVFSCCCCASCLEYWSRKAASVMTVPDSAVGPRIQNWWTRGRSDCS